MTHFDDNILVAYADGELDADTARQVEAAIASDRELGRRVELFRKSGSLVREAFHHPKYKKVSPHLARRLLGRERPAIRLGWRVALPIAASFLAAIIGFEAGIWHAAPRETDFSETLADEVAEYHVVYARQGEHQVEVKADRLDEIQSWLGQSLHRTLSIPDLTERGLIFRGARLLVVEKRPVAQLLYSAPDRKDQPFAVCITTGPAGEIPLKIEEREGLNLALWGRKGFVYVLVGWLDKPLLRGLADELTSKLDEV